MIFFNSVCLMPIKPPVRAFKETMISKLGNFRLKQIICVKMNKGASFCQVDRIKQFIHLIILIVDGYQ